MLFLLGIALAVFLWWALKNTRVGLIIRVVGDSSDAARAMGLNPNTVRLFANWLTLVASAKARKAASRTVHTRRHAS